MRKTAGTMTPSQKQNQMLFLQSEIALAMTSTMQLEEVLEVIAQGVVTHLGYRIAVVGLYHAENNSFSTAAVHPRDSLLGQAIDLLGREFQQLEFSFDFQTHPEYKRFLNGELWVVTDLAEFLQPVIPATVARDMQQLYGTQVHIAVPMQTQDRLVGAILIGSRVPEMASEEREALLLVARQAALAIQNTRLHEALRASEALYRTVTEATLDMVFVLDAEGRLEYGNPRIEAITGHRVADLLGQPLAALLVAEDRFRGLRMFKETLRGRSTRKEIRYYSADNQILVMDARMVPLCEDDQVSGVIGFGNDVTALKHTAELRLRREVEQAGLHAITTAISGTLDLDETLNMALDTALVVTEADAGAIYLWEETPQVLRLVVHRNLSAEFIRRVETCQLGEGITGRAALGQTPLIIGDVVETSFRRGALIEKEGFRNQFSIPLWARDRLMGVLNLHAHQTAQRFSEMSDWLAAVGDQIAIAIENAQLYAIALADSRRDALLRRLSMNLGRSLDWNEILAQTVADLGELAGADRTHFIIVDPSAETWQVTHEHVAPNIEPVTGLKGTFADARVEMDLGLTDQPIVVDDVDADPWVEAARVMYHALSVRSFLLTSVMVRGRLYGALSLVYCREKHNWQSHEVELLESVAYQVSLALENALLYAQARASEARYRTLFESANEAITVETLDGRILDANPRACDMRGYTREEHLRLTVADLLPPQVHGRLPEFYRQVQEQGRTQRETVNLHKDGYLVPVDITASVATVDGEERLFVFARDISERKRLEQQLLQAQRMDAIGTLAGGVAHDFNNLLVGILGYASLLQHELPADSSLQSDVRTIICSAERAADLTRQLLALTRRGHLDMQPLNLNDVATEVVQLLTRTLDKAIVIETHLADDLAAVEGDAGQLHQVILNLALNASDAMPQGGRLIIETENVTLDSEEAHAALNLRPGDHVSLSVTDTGHGMDEETQTRIFEPFFTTKEDGRGLGLVMVYGIVEAHGGAIQVYSESGLGSTFRILLRAAGRVIPDAGPKEQEPSGGAETVLVVDDEEAVRALLKRILERSGYTVLLAEDGHQAVELYRQRNAEIDLIVLDMVMPQMGGREALERLQKINPQVKVLLSSGYSAEGQAQQMMHDGVCGFLQKPYDLPSVLQKVRQVLDAA